VKIIRKLLFITFIILCVPIFSGSEEKYNFSRYSIEYNQDISNYQKVINNYDDYVNICNIYKINDDYNETYFENNSLVLLYFNLSSSDIEILITDIIVNNNQYVVAIEENKPNIISCDMSAKIYFLEESNLTLNNIDEIKVK